MRCSYVKGYGESPENDCNKICLRVCIFNCLGVTQNNKKKRGAECVRVRACACACGVCVRVRVRVTEWDLLV